MEIKFVNYIPWIKAIIKNNDLQKDHVLRLIELLEREQEHMFKVNQEILDKEEKEKSHPYLYLTGSIIFFFTGIILAIMK